MKIKLLKKYKDHDIGKIIVIKDEVANILISEKIARRCTNRDFLIQPLFGNSKAFDGKKLNNIYKNLR